MASVFISHRTSDGPQAERLGVELRRAGHDVWLDRWRIDLGDSIVERIDQGLTNAAYVVICYSSDGIGTPWMSREWMSTLARQLDGHNVRLLPVLLTGGRPPAILADIKYADLTRDWSKGVAELLRALR
jgi:TIR domain